MGNGDGNLGSNDWTADTLSGRLVSASLTDSISALATFVSEILMNEFEGASSALEMRRYKSFCKSEKDPSYSRSC